MLVVLLRIGLFVLLGFLLVRTLRRALSPRKASSSNEEVRHEGRRRPQEASSEMDIASALHILELGNVPDLKEIEQAKLETQYRNLLAQYHPDKVSHLGTELIEVATQKTRKLNEAYQFIKACRGESH
jgi:hypothetical protein